MVTSDFTLYESSPSRQPLPLYPGGVVSHLPPQISRTCLTPSQKRKQLQIGWCFKQMLLPTIGSTLEKVKIARDKRLETLLLLIRKFKSNF